MPFSGKWGMVQGECLSNDESSWKTAKERIPKFVAAGERAVVLACTEPELSRFGPCSKAGCILLRRWLTLRRLEKRPRKFYVPYPKRVMDHRIWPPLHFTEFHTFCKGNVRLPKKIGQSALLRILENMSRVYIDFSFFVFSNIYYYVRMENLVSAARLFAIPFLCRLVVLETLAQSVTLKSYIYTKRAQPRPVNMFLGQCVLRVSVTI